MSSLYGLKPPTRQRHKVFVSYRHSPSDQQYRDHFERLFSEIHRVLISKSVQIGDIAPDLATDAIRQKIRDEYLRDSSVTVVFLAQKRGSESTWTGKLVRAYGKPRTARDRDF